jgi:hypothetical protein
LSAAKVRKTKASKKPEKVALRRIREDNNITEATHDAQLCLKRNTGGKSGADVDTWNIDYEDEEVEVARHLLSSQTRVTLYLS